MEPLGIENDSFATQAYPEYVFAGQRTTLASDRDEICDVPATQIVTTQTYPASSAKGVSNVVAGDDQRQQGMLQDVPLTQPYSTQEVAGGGHRQQGMLQDVPLTQPYSTQGCPRLLKHIFETSGRDATQSRAAGGSGRRSARLAAKYQSQLTQRLDTSRPSSWLSDVGWKTANGVLDVPTTLDYDARSPLPSTLAYEHSPRGVSPFDVGGLTLHCKRILEVPASPQGDVVQHNTRSRLEEPMLCTQCYPEVPGSEDTLRYDIASTQCYDNSILDDGVKTVSGIDKSCHPSTTPSRLAFFTEDLPTTQRYSSLCEPVFSEPSFSRNPAVEAAVPSQSYEEGRGNGRSQGRSASTSLGAAPKWRARPPVPSFTPKQVPKDIVSPTPLRVQPQRAAKRRSDLLVGPAAKRHEATTPSPRQERRWRQLVASSKAAAPMPRRERHSSRENVISAAACLQPPQVLAVSPKAASRHERHGSREIVVDVDCFQVGRAPAIRAKAAITPPSMQQRHSSRESMASFANVNVARPVDVGTCAAQRKTIASVAACVTPARPARRLRGKQAPPWSRKPVAQQTILHEALGKNAILVPSEDGAEVT